MWRNQGVLERAENWFMAACHRLPSFAPAQAHLAEIEAGRGETESAVARLTPLATDSDDPAYAAQLARVLGESNRIEEARVWRTRAAAGYDTLVTRHPAAYAEHAAEFWLTTSADPERALRLACMNLTLRQTPRARDLLAQAAAAFDAAYQLNPNGIWSTAEFALAGA
jgi:hypothetical protein